MKLLPTWKEVGGDNVAFLPNTQQAIATVKYNDEISLTQPYHVVVGNKIVWSDNSIAKCQARVANHELPKYL